MPKDKEILKGLRMLQRSGDANYLTQDFPKLSGFLQSALMGTKPDEMGSVLDPLTAERRAGAKIGFPTGIAAQVAPLLSPLSKFAKGVAMAPSVVPGSMAAQRGVIKAPGGNWLSGSIEDALSGLKRDGGTDIYDRLPPEIQRQVNVRQGLGGIEKQFPKEWAAAMSPEDQFVAKQLTRYVRNDMATERDPIRALAEKGPIHFEPARIAYGGALPIRRANAGFPASDFGESPAARLWEKNTDTAVKMVQAQNLGNPAQKAKLLQADPWLEKLAPTDRVAVLDKDFRIGSELGFDHLMDELRNATNPASGLPANLLLKPESLSRVSVPQAVEHVAKINAWREAQKVEANQALANNAATVLHKDYPDKGFKWVELRVKEGTNPAYLGSGKYEDPSMQALKDALKYEGDTMGHCVGGYCDDVAAGKSHIYSLRNAKGQPHVTIEVAPRAGTVQVTPEIRAANPYLPKNAQYYNPDDFSEADELIPPGFEIVQIKGKGNRKPKDEYLPYVQDFVKSGKWSDVQDFQNTGLVRRSALTPAEQAALLPDQSYLTMEEVQKLREGKSWTPIDNTPEFAAGGSVRSIANAAVGGANLAKQVGSSADAVRAVAAGTASLNDLNSLRQLAATLGYTNPGLTQAMGLAGVAKAGYNVAKDPTGVNAAKFAATVNPVAAQALGLYNAAVSPNAGTLINALSSFNPMTRAYNALANSFDFATLGQLPGNIEKIANPAMPAKLRDLFSNNPNSSSLGRTANEMATKLGMDPMDALMSITDSFGTSGSDGPSISSEGGMSMGQATSSEGTGSPTSPSSDDSDDGMRSGGRVKAPSIDKLATDYAAGRLTNLNQFRPEKAELIKNLAKHKRVPVQSGRGALSMPKNPRV